MKTKKNTKVISIKNCVSKNPRVLLSRIPSDQLRSLLNQEADFVETHDPGERESMAVGASKENILEDKILILEEELCRKNQLIESLQEKIRNLEVERNPPEVVTSDNSFQGSFEEDLNISVDRLLNCKAIAKRRAEEIGVGNQSDEAKCHISSNESVLNGTVKDNVVPLLEEDIKEDKEQTRTPKSEEKFQKERRKYRKNKVSASSIKNMSAWLALAKKENVDNSVEGENKIKRKRTGDEELTLPHSESPAPVLNIITQQSNVLFASWEETGLRIKSFASQHAKEKNLTEKH